MARDFRWGVAVARQGHDGCQIVCVADAQRGRQGLAQDLRKNLYASVQSFISAKNIPVCATVPFPDRVHEPLIGIIVVVPVGSRWVEEEESPVITNELIKQLESEGCDARLNEEERL